MGKCYTLTFDISDYASGSVLFSLNSSSDNFIYSVSADGSYYVNMDITSVGIDIVTGTGTAFIPLTDPVTSLYINQTGTSEVNNLELKLDPECVSTYCSECFELDSCERGMLLQWFNDDNGFGFNYSDVSFIQSMRVEGGLRVPTYDYLDETFYTTSSGEKGMIFNQAWKSKEMWVHELPEYMHDAISTGIAHDHFFVDGVEFVKSEGGYAPDWNIPESLLAPVIVKIEPKTQNLYNDNC